MLCGERVLCRVLKESSARCRRVAALLEPLQEAVGVSAWSYSGWSGTCVGGSIYFGCSFAGYRVEVSVDPDGGYEWLAVDEHTQTSFAEIRSSSASTSRRYLETLEALFRGEVAHVEG